MTRTKAEKLSEARARRAVRWADFDTEGLRDPRKGATRIEYTGLLRLMVAAFATGAESLRTIERFGDELGAAARRVFGLKRGPSDSTLYWLLARQTAHGFGLALVRQVKDALARKWIANDLFPWGVVSFDGKLTWSGHYAAQLSCKQQRHEGKQDDYTLMAQRACLVSSSARPCVAQTIIAKNAGEANTFERTFTFVLKHFRRSFEFVTYDSGGTSRENAALVHDADKAYVFAIKGNQPRVHKAARARLGCKDESGDAARGGEHRTAERADGAEVVREVFRCAVEADDPEIEFVGAKQLWRVHQTKTRNMHGRVVVEVEDRYFITNRVLGAAHALTLVRLHWGIENGPNWGMDMVLGEDDGVPCEKGNGIIVTSWLRLLAYNLVSIWRQKLPPVRDEIVATWERSCDWLRDALRTLDARHATLF